ncbi:BatD family protein [Methylobacterium gnaphalii]|nr:BatD family protein [Methylobacterium gnaphalii]
MGRVLAVLLALLLGQIPARAIEPGDLTLTVTPELSGNAQPYAREMVLLKLRGVYRTQILLEDVRQPALTNFSWTQLGRDSWSRTQLPDGQMALQFERTVAIFPQHTGTFTIEPFVHKLTINDNGERKLVEVRSEPIEFPVAKWTAETGGPDAPEPWWLPARDVTITDSWDPDPETVNQGDTARRIVTLEAQGMLAEGLPPRPIMRTRGIVTFAGPVKRETIITPSGPVARATYQWDLKKGVPEVIALEGIQIPWYDTLSRTMRVTEIPARQIGGGLPDREDDLKPPSPASWATIAAAALAAFGLGLALIGFGARRPVLRLSRGGRQALRRAAAAGDAVAFRAALGRAMQAEPDLARVWRADPDAAAALSALDRTVYGMGDAATPNLTELTQLFSRRRKAAVTVLAEEPRLAPLDGWGRPAR